MESIQTSFPPSGAWNQFRPQSPRVAHGINSDCTPPEWRMESIQTALPPSGAWNRFRLHSPRAAHGINSGLIPPERRMESIQTSLPPRGAWNQAKTQSPREVHGINLHLTPPEKRMESIQTSLPPERCMESSQPSLPLRGAWNQARPHSPREAHGINSDLAPPRGAWNQARPHSPPPPPPPPPPSPRGTWNQFYLRNTGSSSVSQLGSGRNCINVRGKCIFLLKLLSMLHIKTTNQSPPITIHQHLKPLTQSVAYDSLPIQCSSPLAQNFPRFPPLLQDDLFKYALSMHII